MCRPRVLNLFAFVYPLTLSKTKFTHLLCNAICKRCYEKKNLNLRTGKMFQIYCFEKVGFEKKES